MVLFQIVVLVCSAVIHEVSHGYVAQALGDPTAEQAGRLTLNPLKHLDLYGSVLLPLILYYLSAGTFVFGWAKPVPYNPYNLKDPRKGGALIAAAGPASNFLLAIVFSVLFRVGAASAAFAPAAQFFAVVILINLILGVFNLVPIPPLDGSKILFGFLPRAAERFEYAISRYGTLLLLVFIFFGWSLIAPVIDFLFRLFAGI